MSFRSKLLSCLSFCLAAALTQPAAATSHRGQIALTFDDLPGIMLSDNSNDIAHFNRALVNGLKRHRVPATGFIVAGKLEDLDQRRMRHALSLWVHAGFTLGNHTYSHESPSRIPVDEYNADILKGQTLLCSLTRCSPRAPLWFRHPYLETGATLADAQKVDQFLTDHRYRTAPVTLVSQDWVFSETYDDALARHDAAEASHIRQSYLTYTATMVTWYRASAQSVFGRDIPLVALLHASKLNADSIGDLLAIYRRAGLRTVPLAKAMRDPAYKTPDTYASAKGMDWIGRWSLQLGRPLAPGYVDPPEDIAATYRKIDSD
ncbi:polysaccharide deacetylase family protein [Novosphingobium rosa]|uniref:polysaccharide deacetylase family protein n=1 Tax=Novosphingobium rosa TaxID=76978 RepID=UPI000834E9B3|nr:polysaccharide deacetylase family protein [Novosphingobium rosa]